MKKIHFMTAIAVSLGILTSCSQDEELTVPSNNSSNTIAFATNKTKEQTRSAVTINSIDKFTVSAVNEDNSSFFSNEEFTFNSVGGVFQSNNPHYWPTTGTLSFYAISNIGVYSTDANNVPMYTYNNWEAEKDLVAATAIAGEKEIPYPLNFKHLTSQIYVSAEAEDKTEELTYRLVSVKLKAPSTGTYSFANTTGGVGSWEIDNSKTSEYSYDTALPRTFKQNGQIELSSCYWNILPVSDGKLTFRIEYQVLQNSRLITDFTGDKYKECTIENPNLSAGKMYRYNFILSLSNDEEISFTATIEDWQDGDNKSNLIKDVKLESEPVDLGLPSGLKWAQANLGAEKETDYGLYYAWGETTGYEVNSGHSFSDASYWAGSAGSISADLTPAQDAAHVRLKGTWRMPTKTDFEELRDNTTYSFTKIDGVYGGKFTSSNGKYVFFPAAGGYEDAKLYGPSASCSYWSSTYDNYYNENVLYIGDGEIRVSAGKPRYYGCPIRAVHP